MLNNLAVPQTPAGMTRNFGGEERVVFRRLAVFAGSCALDVVEAVTPDDDLDAIDVDDLLDSVVAKSLVVEAR